MLISDKKLSAFENAMDLLLTVTHSTCKKIADSPDLLKQLTTLFTETRANGNLIHITGMGRSFRAAMAFGELLKDNGFEVSYPGKTLARPIHKDDIVFKMNDLQLKNFASQGQLKSFVLSLKLAQYEMISSLSGMSPILMLDDIFDKLDKDRVRRLLELLSADSFGQIFISDTCKD